MSHAGMWVRNICIGEKSNFPWTVCLCYDTDSYNDDITRFYDGDWAAFRKNLEAISNQIRVVDLAAKADIEDIMLVDIDGIARFLNASNIVIPSGGKGKTKMKIIFRGQGKYYHEGIRAQKLINCLNFGHIFENASIPLSDIVKEILPNS